MRHLVVPLLVLPMLLACSQPPPAEEPVRAVRTLTLQSGSTSLQHEYAAEVRARTESRLGFRVADKLVRRMVNAGLLHEARAKNVVQKTAGNVLSLPALPTKAIT